MQSKRLKHVLISATMIITLVSVPISNTAVLADDNTTTQSATTQSDSDNSSSTEDQPNSNNDSNDNGDDTNNSSKQMHTLTHPYVVYGAGSSDRSELADILAVGDNFKTLTATANDYNEFIDPNGSTTNAAMISSVSIVPTDPGSGIKVNIQKFDGKNTITKVTAQQYALVAQMAGVTDVTITVSSNVPVSGESALTGVYKAIQEDGGQLDSQNTQAANQMLDATQGAINANNGDDKYPGRLMAAVGDATKAINEKRQSGDHLDKADIKAILNHRLFFHGCYSTTKKHEGPIVNALIQFNQAPISNSSAYGKHVDDTINNVKKSSGHIMNQGKKFVGSNSDQQDQKQAQSWLDKLIQWAKDTFNIQ